MSELKRCPHCGANAEFDFNALDDGYELNIRCYGEGCFARMQSWARYGDDNKDFEETKAKLIANWNQRV